MSLTSWLGIGALTLLALWIWRSLRALRTFTAAGIPGPRPLPFLGNLLDSFKLGIHEQMAEYHKAYGKIFGIFVLSRPVLFVSDQEVMREIFIKRFSSFCDRSSQEGMKYKPWNQMLLSKKGDDWRLMRGLLSPTFSSGKIKRLVPAIQSVTKSLNDVINGVAEKGEAVELKDLFGRFAMDVIAASVYSIDADSLHNPESEFMQHAKQIMKPPKSILLLLLVAPKLHTWLVRSGVVRTRHMEANDFFMAAGAAAQSGRQDGKKRQDFLQLLMEGQREGQGQTADVDAEIDHRDHLNTDSARKGLTTDEVHGNAFIFLIAGYDTVSTVLAFTTFLLGQPENRACLQAAQREVDEVVGKEEVTYEKANGLTYLEMCVSEALRMYGPAFVLNRECAEDCEIIGVRFTKGQSVTFPLACIHWDPDLWPQPHNFDPLRHTAEAKAARPPFAYMPFGMGPRNCIGMRLAQLEARMALASVLQRFSPVTCDKTVYPPKLSKWRLESQDGLWMKFETRS